MLDENNLIWLDLEMTGLRPERDRILEIACLVTDSNLNILAEGPTLVIKQPESVLAGMDEWNQTHHARSGLLRRVRQHGVSEAEAETRTLDFLRRHVPANTSPICGNSISQDRRFLYQYMPTLEKYFHYRHLDVSSLKILAERWRPEILPLFSKSDSHRALDDIRESVAELRFYRHHLFNLP